MSDQTQKGGGAHVVLRWIVSLHAVAMIVQLTMATLVVAGQAQLYSIHRMNAWAVLALGALVALSGVGFGRSVLGWRFLLTATALPALEALQIWLGRHAETPWHVTTGIVIWAASLALLIKVWRPDAAGVAPVKA